VIYQEKKKKKKKKREVQEVRGFPDEFHIFCFI
jgi:hypothetical protein